MNNDKPIVLCFSGHDATGGAGLQADIESIASLGAHTCSIITALTVQNTLEVLEVYPCDHSTIRHSVEVLLQDVPPQAIKIGLIASLEALHIIIDCINRFPGIPVVLDPVLASGSGDKSFAQPTLIDAIIEQLIPLCTIVTPNTHELLQLSQHIDPSNAASALNKQGCDYVFVTGTHAHTDSVHNALYFNQRLIDTFTVDRLEHSYHGSGCTLASAIAAMLAFGIEPLTACKEAVNFTFGSLHNGFKIGSGQHIPNRLYWASEHDE